MNSRPPAPEEVGALHVRWVPEIVSGRWEWVLYLNGYAFDEIGRTMHGWQAADLQAGISISSDSFRVNVDSGGRVLLRRVMPYPLSKHYDIVFRAYSEGDGTFSVVDTLHETHLSIFPPWSSLYFPGH